MKILFLSDWFPYPPDNGSKIRIYNLLRGLAEVHELTLIAFSDKALTRQNVVKLRSFCENVIVVDRNKFVPHSLKARLGYFSPAPRSILDTFSQEMASSIQETISISAFDLVIASQLGTACYRHYFREIPALFEEVELSVPYERYKNATSLWHQFRNRLTWSKYSHYLVGLLGSYDACTVVSEQEKQLLSKVVPSIKTVEVIPNAIRLSEYLDIKKVPYPNTLIFTGSFRYFANHEAMVWFLSDIFPLIQIHVPDVQVIITGDHANLPLPHTDNITLTGYVDDLRPLLANATVSIAPIQTGGGSRLKILEAMAAGTSVVSTSKGAEGLKVENNHHILIADSAEGFAEQVVHLLKDLSLRERQAAAALEIVRDKYDWEIVIPQFMRLIEGIGSN